MINDRNTRDIFGLLTIVNEALAKIECGADLGENRLEALNLKLEAAISDLADIPARPGTHAWRAKMAGLRSHFRATHCGRDGILPPDAEPIERLMWSVLVAA